MQIDLTQKLKDTEGRDSIGNFKIIDKQGVASQASRPYSLKDSFKTILLSKTSDMDEVLESDLEGVEIADVWEHPRKIPPPAVNQDECGRGL